MTTTLPTVTEVQRLYAKDPLGVTYGALLALGGLAGFLRRGSIPSLLSGVSFGALSLLGVQKIDQSGDATYILLASALMALVMGVRFAKTKKFMPPGFLAVLSVATLYRYGARFL